MPRPHEMQRTNRLASETSPYLLQHRHNPVDWYPWGPEALARATAEDKPILLSVGYSACHWCHVMEHESFEDEETAALMNEHFINVKVDREERPDIDSIYMVAVQQLTGRGGWPMTVFLTPTGEPFYGGTYFPPEAKHGLPSFRQVLLSVAQAYRERREEVADSAQELRGLLQHHASLRAPVGVLDETVLDRAYQRIAADYDARRGGFGRAPKFPQPLSLEVLLRHWRRTGSGDALRMLEHSLQSMAAGGIYDHLGGGFHRYSVDARWLVPHFEKMLYDNALLARLYLHAYQATGKVGYRRVVEETLRYVRREMTGPVGGFFSAQDADSEGVEGKFFVWTPAAIDEALGAEEGPLFRAYFDVTEQGNWEGDHHAPPPEPISILNTPRSLEEVAAEVGVSAERLQGVIDRGREVLYERRAHRTWPGLDDKVLTSWNALMLQAFAEAARILARDDYLETATRNAEFLLRELRRDGTLLRTWKGGQAKIDAFLEDYALLVQALISLYEASFEPRWLSEARALGDTMVERFWESEEGVFYDAARDAEPLVVRPRDFYDNPMPSGNSAAVMALLRLGRLLGEARYSRIGRQAMEAMGRLLTDMPAGFGHLLAALDFEFAPPREVAIVGRRTEPGTQALLNVLASRYLPNVVLACAEPGSLGEAAQFIPLLEGRGLVDGRAAAYVCESYACRMPVTEPAELQAELPP
jgi:uncharacterized protein